MTTRRDATRRTEMIEARRTVGLSQEALAEALGVSVGAVAHWERGLTSPSPRHRKRIAQALDISLTELGRLLDGGKAESPTRSVPKWATHYDALVAGAERAWLVDRNQIPALLQCKAYASAVEYLGPIVLTDEQVLERVERRLNRQAALYRASGRLELVALLAERNLQSRIGRPSVMAEQLDHLMDMADRPNIELRIIPDVGYDICAPGSFELLFDDGDQDPYLAVTFDVDGPRYIEQPALVDMFVNTFDYLDDMALSSEKSLEHIQQQREALTS